MENIIDIYNSGKHLELTNLLINDYNDSKEDISQLIDFILEELGSEVPLHFSRAFPYYKMPNMEPTKEESRSMDISGHISSVCTPSFQSLEKE